MNDEHLLPTIEFRTDLVRRRIWMGPVPTWVVKDPIARAVFYFDDRELAILQLLDGSRTFRDVLTEATRQFAPEHLAAESLLRFLADAARKNLVVVRGSHRPHTASTHSDSSNRPPPWWHNPLAVRLPGLNPDRLLGEIVPRLKWLINPATLAVTGFLILLAGALAIVQFNALADGFSDATGRLAGEAGAWGRESRSLIACLAVVIAITKVCHELAHATACKFFGGECRELGLMFLVGVPCLYCDVSDAWMIAERWKRIIVSAAGMIAELMISAAAIIVWSLTHDGDTRDLAVLVIVVCSVSTVIFNGNPLLRYDGYYILSDLLGIPNLSARGTSSLQQCFRRVLWKSPSELSALAQISPGTRANETIVLSVYSVASTLYRLAVIAIIMMLVLRFSGSAGFGIPAVLLVGLFLIMGARRWLEPIIRPPQGPRHRQGRMSRPVLVASACLAVLTAALCLPFPCSIRTGLLIEPAREVDVYVSTPGFVVKAISPGANVRAGDRIVELFNWQAKLQQLQIEGEARQLEAGLKALSVRRVLDPMAALRMPGSQEKLAATRERLSVVAEEVARLIVRAPRSGRVFAAGIRSATETQHHDQRFDWDGGPLDPNNVGAYMPEGTLLCRVGDEMLREAKMLVRQTEVELIRSGQQVSFTLPGYRLGQLVGKVESVSPTSVNEVSPELAAAGWIATHRRSDGTLRPAGVYYEVRVSWDEGQPIPPARLVGPGRIHVGPMSAARRIRRFVAENFRFQ